MELAQTGVLEGLLKRKILAGIPVTCWHAFAAALVLGVSAEAQMAKGANKFFGNITTRGQVRSDFGTYWNQITPENETKWGSVERTRDQMSWGGADGVSNYAKQAGIPWKFHTLAWGSQFPSWITGLSQADQLAEITEWFDAAKLKYPDVQMIDVVNEAAPGHAPAPYAAALGGNGTTGYDWIFKAFQMARERWPKAILIYNDYNNLEVASTLNWTISMAEAAKKANIPLDAIGCQAHGLGNMNATTLKANLDKMATTGLPIFISEYDIANTNDEQQANRIKEQVPVMWTHPAVVGITYWGYLSGATWINGTGLLTSAGAERPSITWMKTYISTNLNPPNNFPKLLDPNAVSIMRGQRSVASQIAPMRHESKRVYDLNGREMALMGGAGREFRSLVKSGSSERLLYVGASKGD
jgi:endo-1,4-beta-xylanase